jgi:hypothetical protein
MGIFPYRPWVRRAGLSIVLVAATATVAVATFGYLRPAAAFGWAREPVVWAYLGALWLGGAKVYFGTLRNAAEIDQHRLLLRPLHQLRPSSIEWSAMLGTEQMIGGDRLIVYHDTKRGMRFVAMNLNLVKGRRDFLTQLDERLRAMGFAERVVERSRYLSRPA